MTASLLFLLPAVAFGLLFLITLGKPANVQSSSPPDWRDAFMDGSLLWGACIVLITESLGLFGLIMRPWVTVAWAAVALIGVWVGVRNGSLVEGWQQLVAIRLPKGWFGRAVLGGLFLIMLTTLIVAWISPPNNVDSLLYHMSRVAHWTQTGSLRHYATAYHHQLMMPPWAEMAILNLRMLWGGDRPVNLVQWFSMLGSVIGASAVAAKLGANGRGQWLASLFVASIPMGILQSSSTQNDYVVAFWSVCLAYQILRPVNTHGRSRWVFYIGTAAGLGLLTKATAYVYLLPFGIWFALKLARSAGAARAGIGWVAAAAIIGILNSGYWLRNLNTYGGPLGPPEWTRDSVRLGIGAGEGARWNGAAISSGVRQTASLVATAAARNLVTPIWDLNRALWGFAGLLPSMIGPNFEQEMSIAAWNHEDTAGNLLHLAAVLTSVVVFLAVSLRRRSRLPRTVLWYLISTLAGFVLVATVISNGTELYSLRFQLPFVVLSGPVVGLALDRVARPALTGVIAAGFLLYSLPWLLFNNTRPLIERRPWPTRVDSILRAPASEIMFAAAPQLRDPLDEVAARIDLSGCRAVGLRIDSSHPEYLFWWSLGAPESGIRVESVYTYENLERYLDDSYLPCAVICTICGERTSLDGLQLQADLGLVRYFAERSAGPSP